ncbi:TolC family protein [Sulfurimonas sp. SAG-AH-194-C21]|nr:TolC family protein [Sulfurimonas sp. SAG-AH-194-C21]MDF1883496.1 TolC family protein [Sulfurimonas sp. SAG-AH-194-C21]
MKIVLIFMLIQQLLMASINGPTLNEAIQILQTKNLEIKAATLDVEIAQQEEQSVSGKAWGKLDFIQDAARSNDAGNVFGFKLTSREATFGDFGFSEFSTTNPNILNVQPADLNYPNDRNFFQSKLRYEVPLFTGFALSSYSDIMHSMTRMKSLKKQELINVKIFELRKSYYNMALLNNSITNLSTILNNIQTLQNTTQSMIDVGYAKKVDLLEVKSKKGNVQRLLIQMNSNKVLLYHYISFLLNQKISHIIVPSSEISMPLLSDENIISSNLDIQKASTGLLIRKDMLSVDEAAYYPTVGAFGEVATADDTFLEDAAKHQAYTVGARLTWNIFNGGSDGSKIQKSKLELLKMRSQVTLAKNGVKLQVAKIRTQIKSVDEEIKSLTQELELADAIYKNYEGRYREKLSSMNDVIIKQSQQIEKILQLQTAKNRRNEKIFALKKLANTKGY